MHAVTLNKAVNDYIGQAQSMETILMDLTVNNHYSRQMRAIIFLKRNEALNFYLKFYFFYKPVNADQIITDENI